MIEQSKGKFNKDFFWKTTIVILTVIILQILWNTVYMILNALYFPKGNEFIVLWRPILTFFIFVFSIWLGFKIAAKKFSIVMEDIKYITTGLILLLIIDSIIITGFSYFTIVFIAIGSIIIYFVVKKIAKQFIFKQCNNL